MLRGAWGGGGGVGVLEIGFCEELPLSKGEFLPTLWLVVLPSVCPFQSCPPSAPWQTGLGGVGDPSCSALLEPLEHC